MIIVIYMILIYTTVHVFSENYDREGFVAGGSRPGLLDKGDVDDFSFTVTSLREENLTGSDACDWLNETYGTWLGKQYRFSVLPPRFGWEYQFRDPVSGEETWIQVHIMKKIKAGTLDYDDADWTDAVGNFFGAIWNGIGYLINLLTFNIINPVTLPTWLTWVPFIMVLPVWIMVFYWLFPYLIDIIKAIGNLTPFT